MDPLSVVSGISGTVAVGAKVLVALHGFAKGVKSAPEELKLLTRELEDLCKIMDNFRKKTGGQVVNQGIEDSSAAILDIFMQLNQLITEHTVSEKDGFLRKGWKQVKWHYIEKDIADLRVHLNSNKGNLLVALTLANELQNGHSNMKLERVQGALEEVIERLQDHDMQTVATCESFTLQRWQDVPPTIVLSSRPATPNGQISAARSESGILSEAGFSERSIPMSAYQFNDMGNRGKGVLVSDGTHTKAYMVKTGAQRGTSGSEPSDAGISRVGSLASSSEPRAKSARPTPLASVLEPGGGDGAQGAKDDSMPRKAAAGRALVKIPSEKERPGPRGALRGAQHRLKNFRENLKSVAGPRPVSEAELEDIALPLAMPPVTADEPGDGSVAITARAPPLWRPDPPTHGSPKLASERFLVGVKASRDLASGNPPNTQKVPQKLALRRKPHSIWPPHHDGFLKPSKPLSPLPVFLEPIEGIAISRDDGYELGADELVRLIRYTSDGWFYGQTYPNGLVVQFQRSEFRLANSPKQEEIGGVAVRQIEALLKGEGFAMEREVESEKARLRRVASLDNGFGIGGAPIFTKAAAAPLKED